MAAQPALTFRLGWPRRLDARHACAWLLAVGFASVVGGLLAAGSGHIVELLFPGAALVVGTALYLLRPTVYLGFTWWLWFLTPEIRRLVDYQIGWNPISPVMLTPYLVAGVAALTLIRCLPQLVQRPELFPFVLILMALNYGYTIGLVRAGPLPATYGLLTWIVPLVFSFHLVAHWREYPLYRDAMQRTFVWGVLALGIYGIVQFYMLPPWDAYWMGVAPIGSVGPPRPFEVRVWSTMNAPGPFAVTLMAGLLFTFAAKGPLRFIAGASGYVAFLLSLVRSAWLGWAVGAAFLLARVRGAYKMRLLAASILLCLLSLPLLLFKPVAETVTNRFATMQQLDEDVSYAERLALYSRFFLVSVTNVAGEGIGSMRLATKLSDDSRLMLNFDSGVLEIMFVLGWPGTILYAGGLCWLLTISLGGGIPPGDVAAQAARAIVLAVFAQLVFVNTLTEVMGMVFWTFLGLTLSARMFHRQRRNSPAGETQTAGGICPIR